MKKLTRKQRFDRERHRLRRERERKVMDKIGGEHPWSLEDAYRMIQSLDKSRMSAMSRGIDPSLVLQ